jgi:molybdopterin synthase sulfur carrier subunit
MIIPNKNYNRVIIEENFCLVLKELSMIKVEFLGPIGKPSLEMEASTLADVADRLKEDATLVTWLDKCAVALNDTMVNDLSTVLKDGDRVSILPPVCGG